MEEKQKLICERCQVEMEELEVEFTYLSRNFRHKAPRCPICGQVYIPEEIATGRMSEVERMLEEK